MVRAVQRTKERRERKERKEGKKHRKRRISQWTVIVMEDEAQLILSISLDISRPLEDAAGPAIGE